MIQLLINVMLADNTENIFKDYGGPILIAIGAVVLIGAIRRWKFIMDMTGMGSATTGRFNIFVWLGRHYGEKGAAIGFEIMAVILILCGVLLTCATM